MNQKPLSLVYLAAAATMGMMAQGIEPTIIPSIKKTETKYDKNKCKSCKHFVKGGKGVMSTCNNPLFSSIKIVSPLDVACGYYQKRKR